MRAEALAATTEPGLLWVYRFAPDGAATPVAGNEIKRALAQPGWLWIHAGLADARCRLWFERSAPISPSAREVLLGTDEHLRLDIAQEESSDLIVIGVHGRNPLDMMVFGSTTNQVVRAASCSVLTLRR